MKRLALVTLAVCAVISGALQAGEAVAQAKPVGEAVYSHWCAPCHAPGPGHPGTESLQLKYGGTMPAVLVERTDLTPQIVATFVRQGVLLMAPFRKTEITDAELAALAAFVTAKGRTGN
jgi:(+)-pinoresinol hydroxylase